MLDSNYADALQEIAALRAQRDALVAALKQCREELEAYGLENGGEGYNDPELNALIAAAESEVVMADNWLENLKVGDKVICLSSSVSSTRTVNTVTQVTPTQIIVGSTKYRRTNGRRIGDSTWYSSNIQEATPERIKEIRRAKEYAALKFRLRETAWGSLPIEILREVAAVIDRHAAGNSETADAS